MTNLSRGRGQISELTHIAPIKQGYIDPPEAPGQPIRYADRLRTVLGAFQSREDQGFPGVIRLFRGIHTVQWAMLDGDTRLMVNVVFDGPLHGYLRGLAREVPGALNLIWSNCHGWQNPRHDAQLLIDFIERHQVRVGFFYAQHSKLTVPDVENLLHLREAFEAKGKDAVPDIQALQRRLHSRSAPISNAARLELELAEYAEHADTNLAKQAFNGLLTALYTKREVDDAYLETFGEIRPGSAELVSPPRDAPSADSAERAEGIQGNVLSDYPEAHSARMLFIHFPNRDQHEVTAARAWLSDIREKKISFGYQPGHSVRSNIGFTHAGLVALGVNRAVLTQFPAAFVEGMDARSESLGDPKPDATSQRAPWISATGAKRPVHAVLFVYVPLTACGEVAAQSKTESSRLQLQESLEAAGERAQAAAAEESDSDPRLSHSDCTAADRALAGELARHLDAAQNDLKFSGVEIIGQQDLHRPLVASDKSPAETYGVEYFGFRDGLGQPLLPGDTLRANYAGAEEQPSFDPVLRKDEHGLLKDATFCVARRLRQDPDAFWKSLQAQASGFATKPSKRELAEQIVGRRMDGRRLDSPRDHYDPVADRFAFDPGATSTCPFHSHVRRSNPRVESSLVRNPTLIRRSLAFVDREEPLTEGEAKQAGGAKRAPVVRGLMFMAFNADLETQFELIQRNWLQAGNQVGLTSRDRDVLTGLRSSPRASAASTRADDEATPARFHADLSKTNEVRELVFPQAFVHLEWGIYLYFPAKNALRQL